MLSLAMAGNFLCLEISACNEPATRIQYAMNEPAIRIGSISPGKRF
jgi:hypothetical protein